MSVISVERIVEVISKTKLAVDPKKLNATESLRDQGIDSLDFSSILFNLEEEFGIEIKDEEMELLQTIEQITGFISKKVS